MSWTHNAALDATHVRAQHCVTHWKHAHKLDCKHYHRLQLVRVTGNVEYTFYQLLLPSPDLLSSTVFNRFPISGRQVTPVASSVCLPSRLSHILALGNLGLSRWAWLEPWLSVELSLCAANGIELAVVNPAASMVFLSLIFNHCDPFFFCLINGSVKGRKWRPRNWFQCLNHLFLCGY